MQKYSICVILAGRFPRKSTKGKHAKVMAINEIETPTNTKNHILKQNRGEILAKNLLEYL